MRIVSMRETTWINGTPTRIWRHVEDLERWPTWSQDLVHAKWVGSQGWKVGHRFRLRYRGRARPALGSGRISEVIPERCLTWSDRLLALSIAFRLAMSPEGSGTRVDFSTEFGGWGLRFVGSDSWTRRVARLQKAFLVDLRETCEQVSGDSR